MPCTCVHKKTGMPTPAAAERQRCSHPAFYPSSPPPGSTRLSASPANAFAYFAGYFRARSWGSS